jgi:hypothetical protein
VRPGELFEKLRDLVIHRSQIGKKRLDRVVTRRSLDQALRELGRRYRLAVEVGGATVPEELVPALEEATKLERRLAEEEQDLADLEKEHPSGKQ